MKKILSMLLNLEKDFGNILNFDLKKKLWVMFHATCNNLFIDSLMHVLQELSFIMLTFHYYIDI